MADACKYNHDPRRKAASPSPEAGSRTPGSIPKLIWGAGAADLGIVLLGLIGRMLWNLDLVFTGIGAR